MLYGAQKQHDPGTLMNRCPLSSQSSCVIRHSPDSQYSRPSLQSHLMQSPFQNVSPSPYDLPSYEHCLSQPVSSRTHFLVSGSLTHPSSHMQVTFSNFFTTTSRWKVSLAVFLVLAGNEALAVP